MGAGRSRAGAGAVRGAECDQPGPVKSGQERTGFLLLPGFWTSVSAWPLQGCLAQLSFKAKEKRSLPSGQTPL